MRMRMWMRVCSIPDLRGAEFTNSKAANTQLVETGKRDFHACPGRIQAASRDVTPQIHCLFQAGVPGKKGGPTRFSTPRLNSTLSILLSDSAFDRFDRVHWVNSSTSLLVQYPLIQYLLVTIMMQRRRRPTPGDSTNATLHQVTSNTPLPSTRY